MLTPQKLRRHMRFWNKLEPGEGAYISLIAPLTDDPAKNTRPPLRKPASLEEQWLGVDYAVERAETRAARLYFGLDAIQTEFLNIGPGSLAAMIGGSYELQPGTVWYDLHPIINSWDTVPDFKLNREHELFKAVMDQTAALTAASKDRWVTSFTDIGGSMDVLWSLRGEELLTDMIEYPEAIEKAEYAVNSAFLDVYNSQLPLLKCQSAYTGWFSLVNTKPWYPLQCDMSVMISPAMFERFVLPGLARLSEYFGQSVYHLDGPGEIRHLDLLLSIPQLHAIQWVPLPSLTSNGGRQDFVSEESLGVYRKTLKAGRKLVLCGVPLQQIPVIFNEVGCDGIFIITWTSSRAETDQFIAQAENEWIKR